VYSENKEKHMHAFLKLVAAVAVISSLSGCVVAVGNDDFDDDDDGNNWKKTQQYNQNYVSGLKMGTDIGAVRQNLGVPAFSESFNKQGETVDVLFYRTHHSHSDGMTSKDECTALIFKRGVLVGWGDKAYQNL
jgi:hypothetical protein